MFSKYKIFCIVLLLVFSCSCENDKKDWRAANKTKTIASYENYLRNHPNGDFAEKAQSGIVLVALKNAKEKRSINDLKAFKEDFPDSKQIKIADELINKFADYKASRLTIEEMANCSIVVETELGNFEFKLLPEKAPEHSRNIIKLAFIDFYNGQIINAVRSKTWIRMGDLTGNGMGGPGYMIKAEINDTPAQKGSVMMWHLLGVPDSGGSQFFVLLDEMPELQGKYTIFGEVSDGIDVIQKISESKTLVKNNRDSLKPDPPIFVKKVWVNGLDLDSKTYDSVLKTNEETNIQNTEGGNQ